MRFLKPIVLFSLCLFILQIDLLGQGGINFNSPDAQEGYLLCSNNGSTYLIDECGKIVNQWKDTYPQYHSKLTEDGTLLYMNQNTIYERDWDDNIVVEIHVTEPNLKLEYDLIKMNNGNYLVNCRRSFTTAERDSIGWSNSIALTDLFDGVVEISPSGEVVWEWNIYYHTIQDQTPGLSNYGVLEDHPQRMNIWAISTFDWQSGESFMFNGIDYNEELDQILISVRKVGEFIIIDHSTTPEESHSHQGGKYGKGGDILYRWGNPTNYSSHQGLNQQLFYQHNPNWIKHGEHKGKIIVFNNGLTSSLGTNVMIIAPPHSGDGFYVKEESAYGPDQPDQIITSSAEIGDLSSDYTSGAKVLENGNIFITIGESDRFIEVNGDHSLVWDYRFQNPQYTYRTEKYSMSHPAFIGKDLMGDGTLESPSSTYDCNIYTSTTEISASSNTIEIIISDQNITLSKLPINDYRIIVYDLQGQKITEHQFEGTTTQFSIANDNTSIAIMAVYDSKGLFVSRKLWIH